MQNRFVRLGSLAVALTQPTIAFVFFLSASATVHAQVCMNINPSDPADETFSPMYWAPGQNYTVTFTDPNGEFFSEPSHQTSLYVFDQSEYVPGGPVYQEDPYVTVSSPTYISPTETTFNVSVAAGAPVEGDGLNFTCFQSGFFAGPGYIEITPCAVPVTPTITSIEPATWTAGVATEVTITGTGFITGDGPNYCFPTSLAIATGSGSVSVLSQAIVSSTQITATVEPYVTDPAEAASVTASDPQYTNPTTYQTTTATAQIAPTTCPIPHVSSVSPNVWFAGSSYRNVTFTGTNFITKSQATATCPATTLSINTGDGSVTVSGVSVSSSTKITATVRVASDSNTEAATADAYGDTGPTADADVLGDPVITWASDPDGTSPTISGPYATDPDPSAVVGQQIYLTTEPDASMLAGLPVPLTFSATAPTTWTVTGGTNIGGYTPTPTSFATGSVTEMTLDTSTLTFYSVYPAASVSVAYSYCVSGETTCPEGTATFEVTFPGDSAMTTDAYNAVLVDMIVGHQPCLPTDLDPYLQYGVITGYDPDVCPDQGGEIGDPPGIQFTPPTAYSGGSYSLVQVLPAGNITTYASGTSTGAYVTAPGLDGTYPYPYGSDAPGVGLGANYSEVSRDFAATMYLLWTSDVPSSIPVPIGYQKWCFQTTTANPGYPTGQSWTTPVSQYVGTDGGFVLSSTQATSQTTPYGYPTWTVVASTTWSTPAPTNPAGNCP